MEKIYICVSNLCMKAKINITGVIEKDVTLKSVLAQYKSFDSPTEAEFILKSAGGNVDEGDAIYGFIQNLEIPTTAIIEKAYSITAKIARACDTKIVLEGEDRVMIHFAWAKVEGKAEKLEMMASILRDKEDEFASFYSKELDVDSDTIRALLDNETMLSSKEAVELGFADYETAEVLALSTINVNTLNNNDKMKDKNKKGTSVIKSIINALKKIETNEVKALVVQDSNGTDVDFVDLEEGDVPKVGDKAEVDGSAVSDGSYIMPQYENKTFVFGGGVVTEVNEEEAEEEEAEVVAEEIQEVMTWSVNVTNTSFAVGDVLMYDYDGESYAVGANEYRLKDGRSVVTDASGKIVVIKEAVEEAEIVETISDEEVSAELVETLAQFKKGLQKDFDEKLAKEVSALKAGIKSPELKAEGEEVGGLEVKFASKGAEILASRRK